MVVNPFMEAKSFSGGGLACLRRRARWLTFIRNVAIKHAGCQTAGAMGCALQQQRQRKAQDDLGLPSMFVRPLVVVWYAMSGRDRELEVDEGGSGRRPRRGVSGRSARRAQPPS